jgi:hypothetical protein
MMLLGLGLLSSRAPGQETESVEASSTRWETWPELDVYVRLPASMKLYGLVTFSSARKAAYSEGQYGIHWDISWKRLHRPLVFRHLTDAAADEKLRPLTFRLGYRSSGTIEDQGEPFHENRGIVELHLRWLLKGGVLVSDRNRVDLRWIDGVYSTRYRNRVLAEREIGIGRYRPVPYASAEFYYDSRHSAWSRKRYLLGLQSPIPPRFMLDTYYARQDDSRPVFHVNALGVALNVLF